jgi:hypothetical protein
VRWVVSKKWKGRIITAIVMIVAIAPVAVYINIQHPCFDLCKVDDGAAAVTAEGGTFNFPSGLSVVVPKGAVDGDATLQVSKPSVLDKSASGPFTGIRTAGVVFDVALNQGGKSTQPKAPLEIVVPLKDGSSFRPAGVKGSIPLAYTPDEKGGYLLLPSKKTEDQALHVTAAHLSPKYVTFVTDQALLDSFFPDKVKADPSVECKQEISVSDEKVKIGPKSQGWSLNSDSAIFACLSEGADGNVQVGVVNRIDYILSVAATSDVRLASSRGDADEELYKLVANFLPGGEKVKTLLGRGGKMVGSINPDDLPSTIELQGQFRTFIAESAVRLLGLAIGILTGEGKGGKTLELLGKALSAAGLVTCLQSSLGKLPEDSNVASVVTSTAGCFGALFEAVASQIDLGNVLWRIPWMADAFSAIIDTVVSSMNGIKLTLANTLRVQVVKEPPPFSFVGEWKRYRETLTINGDGTGERVGSIGVCFANPYHSCSLHIKFTVKQDGDGRLKGVVTSNWYKDGNDGSIDTVNGYNDLKGYTFIIAHASGGIISDDWGGRRFNGSQWCGSTASASELTECDL